MTPILLSDPDTKIAFLKDAVKCEVTEERNGMYELELEYPVAGQYFSDIAANCYIKAKPNSTADPQLFRIYSVSKPILGTVTVNAEHISYALSHYPIRELTTTKTTALAAISRVLSAANQFLEANHKFIANYCDISSSLSFGISNVSARAALGGVDGSVLDRYGGEYEFDNYKVKLHKSRGKDNGVIIKYGKNMTEMKLTVSTENSYTGIYPYVTGDNDECITLSEGAIHVDNNSGIEERILSMDFSSYFDDEEEKSEANLRKHVNEYLGANDINSADASMTVSMIDLAQSAHAGYTSCFEAVSLCDTVKVVHTIMGVSIKLKVVKTVYDSIAERYVSLELGSVRSDFSDVIKQIQKTTNQALKKASEIPDTSALEQQFQTELDEMTKAITGASGGHVILNPSQNPQELLILCDSDSIEKATKLYRWNSAGLAYSSDGYNGTYSAGFLGADGKLIINNVTARSISANLIKAGIITSENGSLLVNLDDNEIISKDDTAKLKIHSKEIDFIGQIEGNKSFISPEEDIYTNKTNRLGMQVCSNKNYEPQIELLLTKATGSTSYTYDGRMLLTTGGAKFDKTISIGEAIDALTPVNTEWKGFRVYRQFGSAVTPVSVTWGIGADGNTPLIAAELKDSGGNIRNRLNIEEYNNNNYVGEMWLSNSSRSSKRLLFGVSELEWGGSTVTVSSLAENKNNIEEVSSVLSLFSPEASQIYSYNFGEQTVQALSIDDSNTSNETNTSYGFVIGENYVTPKEVLSSDGNHISLYSMAALSWKAIQELVAEIENLKQKIWGLENKQEA